MVTRSNSWAVKLSWLKMPIHAHFCAVSGILTSIKKVGPTLRLSTQDYKFLYTAFIICTILLLHLDTHSIVTDRYYKLSQLS